VIAGIIPITAQNRQDMILLILSQFVQVVIFSFLFGILLTYVSQPCRHET
jgi:hypothetical protein